MKCRSEEQSFPLARLQRRGLSSLSVFPQGRNSLESLESLSCQPHAIPQTGDAFANSSPAATRSGAGPVPPFRRPRGMRITEARSTPFLAGVRRGSTPQCRGQQPQCCCRCLPRHPPCAPPPAADVVTLGTLVRGTQLRGFLSRSEARSSLLSEMLIIRSVPTTARGKKLACARGKIEIKGESDLTCLCP